MRTTCQPDAARPRLELGACTHPNISTTTTIMPWGSSTPSTPSRDIAAVTAKLSGLFSFLALAFLIVGTSFTCDLVNTESPQLELRVQSWGIFTEHRLVDYYFYFQNDGDDTDYEWEYDEIVAHGPRAVSGDPPFGEPSLRRNYGRDCGLIRRHHDHAVDIYGPFWQVSRVLSILALVGLGLALVLQIHRCLVVYHSGGTTTTTTTTGSSTRQQQALFMHFMAALYFLTAVMILMALAFGLSGDVCDSILAAEREYWTEGELFLQAVREHYQTKSDADGDDDDGSLQVLEREFDQWRERLDHASCHAGTITIILLVLAASFGVASGGLVLLSSRTAARTAHAHAFTTAVAMEEEVASGRRHGGGSGCVGDRSMSMDDHEKIKP